MFQTSLIKPEPAIRALNGFRIVIAILIGIHGWYRFLSGGAWLFGQHLQDTGWPFGVAIAWAITVFECLGMIALLFNRLVIPICLTQVFILSMGIYLVHAPEGWFVVGAGRNGVEYSVLLISGLLLLSYANWPYRKK